LWCLGVGGLPPPPPPPPRPSGRGSALLVWRDDRAAIAEARGFPRYPVWPCANALASLVRYDAPEGNNATLFMLENVFMIRQDRP
jgi:hypothetical protein